MGQNPNLMDHFASRAKRSRSATHLAFASAEVLEDKAAPSPFYQLQIKLAILEKS
ncbi:hypothetical protein KSX_57170 [Ktedonospora formicarum]|uniref:Uncharacterized protein n=1 Tax=Ktedonospora formicarum TaxID=2778364 RepID=A0A8J3I8U4_9CHLR|nr:hypothetical protein KSX_57170 [Ktedonospora formicarum]